MSPYVLYLVEIGSSDRRMCEQDAWRDEDILWRQQAILGADQRRKL